jgi:hypothetical protein
LICNSSSSWLDGKNAGTPCPHWSHLMLSEVWAMCFFREEFEARLPTPHAVMPNAPVPGPPLPTSRARQL